MLSAPVAPTPESKSIGTIEFIACVEPVTAAEK
jgi:hypothetical protein